MIGGSGQRIRGSSERYASTSKWLAAGDVREPKSGPEHCEPYPNKAAECKQDSRAISSCICLLQLALQLP